MSAPSLARRGPRRAVTPAPAIVGALWAAVAATLGACATAPTAPPTHARHGLSVRTSSTASLGMYPAAWGLPSRLIDTRRRQAVSMEEALQDILQSRVVYVGESHDNPHHHAVQAALLLKLWAADHRLGVGMEMFQRPYQGALDAFGSGEIDEATMLERTEYSERWGHDFTLYRPLVQLAAAHKIPLYALNAPRELTRKVARQGLDALTPVERAEVPELDRSSHSHRAMVEDAFAQHGMSPDRFESFYTAQLIWDETMADTVARALRAPEAPTRMLVLAGVAHVHGGLGIPRRAARRGAKPHVIVVPVMIGEGLPSLYEQLDDPGGDYLWVMSTDASLLPAVGTLIEEPPTEDDGAITAL